MRRVLVVLALLLALAVAANGQTIREVVCSVHLHSGGDAGSDGGKLMADVYRLAHAEGAEVVVVNDHLENFNEAKLKARERAYLELGNPVKFYQGDIPVLNPTGKPQEKCVIRGSENGVFAKEGDPDYRFCHFLVIGGSGELYADLLVIVKSDEARNFATAKSALAKIVARAHQSGAVVIAAHPTAWGHEIGADLIALCDGVEMFNFSPLDVTSANAIGDVLKNPFSNDMEGCVKLLGCQKNALVTAGVDAHFSAAEDVAPASDLPYQPALRRYTIVLLRNGEEANSESVVGALRGRCAYVAFGDARVRDGKEMIGRQVDPTKPFHMGFTEVPDGKGWVMCVAEDGRAMLKTVPIRNGAIDIPKLRGFLGDDLPDDGWIYIAVPAGKPVVVTSAISVQNRQEEQPPRVAEKPKKQEGPALGGVWVGEMKQGIYPAGYDFAMDLRQEGTRVTGTTRVAYRGSDPDNYGLMGVEGSFTGTTLTLKETSVIANHPPAGHSWCIKVLSLGWAPGSPPSLSGSWNAPDGCGTIFVTRAVLPGEE